MGHDGLPEDWAMAQGLPEATIGQELNTSGPSENEVDTQTKPPGKPRR